MHQSTPTGVGIGVPVLESARSLRSPGELLRLFEPVGDAARDSDSGDGVEESKAEAVQRLGPR